MWIQRVLNWWLLLSWGRALCFLLYLHVWYPTPISWVDWIAQLFGTLVVVDQFQRHELRVLLSVAQHVFPKEYQEWSIDSRQPINIRLPVDDIEERDVKF